jgi:hypothetical protein
MDPAHNSWLAVNPPPNLPESGILHRNDSPEMACLAGYVQVSVVGDLLVVLNVTSKAVSRALVGMAILRSIRMTHEAGQLTVRGRRICRRVNQGYPGTRF